MSEKKQLQILGSSCAIVSGAEPVDFAIHHLIKAGVGTIELLGDADYLAEFGSLQCASNPDVNIVMHESSTLSDPDDGFFEGKKVVLEAALDWQFKLRLSDMCMRLDVPLIHCGSDGLRFQLFTMIPGKSSCLRCALPAVGIDDVPLQAVARNTFAPVAACAGSLMALEAIKLLCGLGVTQGNEFWKVDGLSGEIEIVRGMDRHRDCPDCGRSR